MRNESPRQHSIRNKIELIAKQLQRNQSFWKLRRMKTDRSCTIYSKTDQFNATNRSVKYNQNDRYQREQTTLAQKQQTYNQPTDAKITKCCIEIPSTRQTLYINV